MVDLSSDELVVTVCASEFLESSEHLPEDVLPSYLLLSQKHDELVNVPVLITLVLCNHVSMKVDTYVRFRTTHPISLLICI